MADLATKNARLARQAQARQTQQFVRMAGFGAVVVVVLAAVIYLLAPLFAPQPSAVVQAGNTKTVNIQAAMDGFDVKEIRARVGETVKVNLRSMDNSMHSDGGGKHQFAIDQLGVNIIAQALSLSSSSFTPDKPGTYTYYCDICCGGKANPTMNGKLIVEGQMAAKWKKGEGSARLGAILLVSLGALGVMALSVYWGFIHPHEPMAEAAGYLPAVTIGAVVVGGLIDGINPCAFTVLLLFVTAMLATLQASTAAGINAARARIVGLGSIYILSVFLTYLALGIGLLATSTLFSRFHAPARIGALLAIGMGLWMVKDYFLPGVGPRLAAPRIVGQWTIDAARKMTVPALITGGFLIGLCTVPCSGVVYLAVLSLLAMQSSSLVGFVYLVLYNLMFILPLAALLIVASARPTLNKLAHWNLHHKEWVRLTLGTSVVLMGLLILATV